jgi:hypothetical protein
VSYYQTGGDAVATVELLERYPQTEITTDALDTNPSLEAGSMFEEAERSHKQPDQPETRQWHYQMPFAGVRYYSF